MKKQLLVLLFAATIFAVGNGYGQVVDLDDLNYWGTGSNRSALVVDWNDGKTNETLAWGFRWDGPAPTVGDLLGSLAAVAAGIVIIFTGKVIADPLLSLFVSLLLLKATYRLIINSGHILLQGAPSGLTAEIIIDEIKKYIPEIKNIHHFHIWSLYTGKNYITLHINLAKEEHDYSKILKKTKEILHDKFDIEHSTIQIEYDECIDLDC